MTPREKRKRQKRRNDVRKVHRFGFSDVDGSRYDQWSLCGKAVNARNGKGSRAVPDAAFSWLPRAAQCNSCVGAYPHGTHEHLMAVELLVAMLQRLWAARLEVGHRCYVSLVPRHMIDGGDGREAAGYTFCTCDGEPKWLDARTSYCPPRLHLDKPAWEAYYGMPYEKLPSQADRRWAPSAGTIQQMLASKPREP